YVAPLYLPSFPTRRSSDLQDPAPATCVTGCSIIGCHSIKAPALARHVHEVNKRHNKHPNQIHKVPVQAEDFDVVGMVTTLLIARSEEHTSELQSRGHLVCR